MEARRSHKTALFDHFARIGKAVSNGRRLELIDVLAQGERTVEELAHEAGLTIANASQHLQVLRRARLVETRPHGTHVYYRLAGDDVFRLWQAMRDLGERRLAEIDRIARDYLTQRDRLEPVRMPELLDRLQYDGLVVLDVRPAPEYRAGHIVGARSIPIDELERRLADLPADADVIAYCRGPYCVYADDAVDLLRRHGLRARRLDLGFPDWRAAGYPTAAAPEP